MKIFFMLGMAMLILAGCAGGSAYYSESYGYYPPGYGNPYVYGYPHGYAYPDLDAGTWFGSVYHPSYSGHIRTITILTPITTVSTACDFRPHARHFAPHHNFTGNRAFGKGHSVHSGLRGRR